MISTQQATELATLADLIHEQMLHDYQSSADAPTALAHRALHRLLTGMVNSDDTTGHARITFPAPTGFGKSSGAAAFIIAAHQLQLLGKYISVTYAASRVSQLYDFETMLLDNGIPKDEIRSLVSVLHGSKIDARGVTRRSDEHIDVPVLLITHERMRSVYRRAEGWAEKDLCYFLKYKGHERSMVMWDERCTTTESKSVKVDDLRQAIAAFQVMLGHEAEYRELMTWLLSAQTSILDHNRIPHCSPEQQQRFYQSIISTRSLSRDARTTLRDFLESLRFTPRVHASETNGQGIIHYKVVLPDQAQRVLNLDASYSIAELAQISSRHPQGFINAESVSPELKEMHRVYGKRLKDLRDCSTQTLIHWNKGCGKEIVERDAKAYLENAAVGGNVILEMLDIVRQETEQGKAVVIWTHARGFYGGDTQRSVSQCLQKAGLLDSFTVDHKPLVSVDNYGQHDATNKYTYTQVCILLGVMRRNENEVAAAISGAHRNINTDTPPALVRKVVASDIAVTILQTTGRSCSRKMVNGRCTPQTTYMIYPQKGDEDIEAVLRPQFPKAEWEVYRPRFKMVGETASKKWVERVKAYLDTLPIEMKTISSRRLKETVEARGVAADTWTRIVNRVCEESSNVTKDHRDSLMVGSEVGRTPATSTAWKRNGQSLVRVEAALYKFEVVEAA